jgi:hypothetical protein
MICGSSAIGCVPLIEEARNVQTIKRFVAIEVFLWAAAMEGTPAHPEWRWADIESLQPGATAGSLCCELGLRQKDESRINL